MNSEQEKARLLHLHRSALQAHLEKDAGAFLAAYASQWYDVRSRGIRLRSKEEALPAIDQYFRRTHFADIHEITAPIIHLSADASMAWVIGEIGVRASQNVNPNIKRLLRNFDDANCDILGVEQNFSISFSPSKKHDHSS